MEVPDIEDVKAMSRAIKNYAKAIEEREKVRNDDFREYSLGDEALEEYLIKSKLQAEAEMFLKVVNKAWMKSHSS